MRHTSIGFAIHDAARDARAFSIDLTRAEALVFGETAPLRLSAPGVLGKHLVVLPHEGKLLAASSSEASPALVEGRPIGKGWTPLPVPCRVTVGGAAIDFYATDALAAPRPPAPALPRLDVVESTAVRPLELPAKRPSAPAPAPSPSSDEIRAQASSGVTTGMDTTAKSARDKALRSDDSLAVRAAIRLRDDYKRLSTPKRLLVPIAAALLVLVSLPGTSHGTALETARYVPPAAVANDLSAAGAAGASTASGEAAAAAPGSSAAPSGSSASGSSAPQGASAPATAARPSVLPSGRSLPSTPKTTLTRAEKIVYHKAIDATLTGDFDTAYRLYDLLLQAHPDSDEIKAAHKVIALKSRAKH
ncbi:MAG: hypothetical protein JST00_42765 [Deltaproteobacteria bacterium]|nr:hypothetical protein [Deltaproteobacteria bacterium]